jgi:hypothetical protein
MFIISRLAKSSLLVLLVATLATAAYAHGSGGGGGGGSGHNGSNGPTGPSVPIHDNQVQSNARAGPAGGNAVVSKKGTAHGCVLHGICRPLKPNRALESLRPIHPSNSGTSQVQDHRP